LIKPHNYILEQRFRMYLHDSHVYMLSLASLNKQTRENLF